MVTIPVPIGDIRRSSNLFPLFDTHSANEMFCERAPSRKDGQVTCVPVDIPSPLHLELEFLPRQCNGRSITDLSNNDDS